MQLVARGLVGQFPITALIGTYPPVMFPFTQYFRRCVRAARLADLLTHSEAINIIARYRVREMRINRLQLTLHLLASLSIAGPSFAQQNVSQSCDVPLVVGYWRKLHRKDLTVHLGSELVSVGNAFPDDGPKRVAVILDSSRQISEEEWKVLLDITSALVEHARPQDTFSLYLVGADDSDGPFLTTGDVRTRLRKFALSSPSRSSPDGSERNYDAILAAVMHLTPSKFGDVILFLGNDTDSDSKVSLAQVQELILRNRVTFYGLSFYSSKIRRIPSNASPSQLDLLSHETGYFISYMSPELLAEPEQVRQKKEFVIHSYAGHAEPYRVSIPGPSIPGPVKLEITVPKSMGPSNLPEYVHYPRTIYPCGTPPSTTQH